MKPEPPAPSALPNASSAPASGTIWSHGSGDEAAPARVDDDCGCEPARERSEDDPVPDLLRDDLRGVTVPDRALLGLGDRERDEEQGHADAVVEAALDIEALADPDGQASGGHDGLTEGGVSGREDDGEHERLRPARDRRAARARRGSRGRS